MAIGGFNGSDPSPMLDRFKQYVEDGKIHYFVMAGSATFYDLTRPKGSG